MKIQISHILLMVFSLVFVYTGEGIAQKHRQRRPAPQVLSTPQPTPKTNSKDENAPLTEQGNATNVSLIIALLIVFAVIVGIPLMLVVAYLLWRSKRQKELASQIALESQKIAAFINSHFLVEACSKCQEYSMYLIEISPNARSIVYACAFCSKSRLNKKTAVAGNPDASNIFAPYQRLASLVTKYKGSSNTKASDFFVPFRVAPNALPYEQTQRTSIPKAMVSEVWRRDGNCCVYCGSKENLHLDHIIPVSKGGATCVENLQLLCRQCNLHKGAKI